MKNQPIHIGVPCWGTQYIDKFLNYALPSMMSTQNIPYLCKQGFSISLCIYTFESDSFKFKSNIFYQFVKTIIDIEFVFLDAFQAEKSNQQLFCYSHELSVKHCGEKKIWMMLVCADAVFTNGSFEFAVNKLVQGFEAVLHSPIRVNDKNAFDELNLYSSAQEINFSSSQLKTLVLKELHDDEKKLAFPTGMKGEGWPGIPSWKSNTCYIKHSFYFNPLIVKVKSGYSLRGSTLDNASFMEEFIDCWDKVYVSSDVNEIGAIDLAPMEACQVKIENCLNTPNSVAEFVAIKMVQKWQYNVFQEKIIICEQENIDYGLYDLSNSFVESVKERVLEIDEFPHLIHDARARLIRRYYENLGINFELLKEKVNYIQSTYRGKLVVFYGAGSFLHFLLSTFSFISINLIISDRDEEKVRYWGKFQNTMTLEDLSADVDVVIPISMTFEVEMKSFINCQNHPNLIIDVMDWRQILVRT